MGKNFIGRPETIVHRVTSALESGTTTYDIKTNILPPGSYYLALHVKSALSAADSTVSITPFVDSASTQVAKYVLRLGEPDDTAFVASLTIGSGASGAIGRAIPFVGAVNSPTATAVTLNGGVRITTVANSSTAGGTLEIDLVATRVG